MPVTVFGEIGFLGMLTTVSAIQGICLAIYLLITSRAQSSATNFLVLLISLMSLHLADMTFAKTRLLEYFVWVSDSSFFFLFLIGPLYYFHVQRLLDKKKRFRWTDTVHLIPALYIFVSMLPWLLTDPSIKLAWQQKRVLSTDLDIPASVYIQLAFNTLQIMLYARLSRQLVEKTRKTHEEESADAEIEQNLRTLSNLSRFFSLWTVCYLVVFLALIGWGKYGEDIDHLWLFVTGLFVQATGVIALQRPILFSIKIAPSTNTPSHSIAKEGSLPTSKYEKSALSKLEQDQLSQAFQQLMEAEKPFRNPELRMPDIASKLNTTPHHLSQMMNQNLGNSFLNIINEYRVKDVIGMMENQKDGHSTILSMAFAAGFNNKNSFNRCIRETTGQTPTSYRKTRLAKTA